MEQDDPIRTRLLDAGAIVFAERGYDGARVAEIARRAGLTTGAIYHRYRGKADLLLDTLDRCLAGEIEAVLADPATTPTAALSILGAHLLDPDRYNGSLVLLEAVVAARRDAELAAMLQRRLEDERSRVGKVIEEAKAAGLFDHALDTHAVVVFCQAVGLGFVLLRATDAVLPAGADWQLVIDRVVAAAAPQPTSPKPSGGTTHHEP